MRNEKVFGERHGRFFELEPTKVSRYIWHVTCESNRANILSNGLLPSDNNDADRPQPDKSQPNRGLLFANNLHDDLERMWPIRFQYDIGYGVPDDICDFAVRYIVDNTMGLGWDFWRIDTRKTNARWFLDPILAREYRGWGLKSKYHYVCTPDRVEMDALDLFVFEPEFREKLFIKWGEGVASVSYNHLPLRKIA